MGKPEIAGPRRARPGPAPAPAPARRTTGRVRWFVLGAVLGAVGALAARGEARATFLDLRQWSARELRKLEHHPQSAVVAAPVVVAAAPPTSAVPDTGEPCTMNPAPGDPCAELLAPFLHPAPQVAANDIPWVRVEDLPRVHPPTVARRHHGRHAPMVAPVDPPADADEAATPTPAPRPDYPIAAPATPPEQTAENDTRW